MRIVSLALLVLAFLQTTVISLDLVLVALVVRTFLVNQSDNLWLAFAFGLLVSLLTPAPLGLYSLIYILCMLLILFGKRFRLTYNWLVIIPFVFVCSVCGQFLLLLLNHQSWNVWSLVIQSLIALPMFLLVKLWEERFIVPEAIRLKL